MEPILKLPTNYEVIETKRSFVWLDSEGILYGISKKNAPATTIEEVKELLDKYVEVAKGKKICMLVDVTNATPNDKKVREYIAVEFPKTVSALAMVSASAVGRMVATLFFVVKPTPYPAKIFATEKEAKEWLKQYL
jgi:hypothetical protein